MIFMTVKPYVEMTYRIKVISYRHYSSSSGGRLVTVVWLTVAVVLEAIVVGNANMLVAASVVVREH